ncbi:CHAT domain-containing protein [Micromonospora sp. HUAS LYJ1]|uniref:CHAT domain-containing protein n=1 Tax=Micromonospora sp. HUAS LYJ1 TaxID=3061626 RepID=UPI0026732EB2|nr:CHAT domain-containing protein [Micromonospora sp. HUAS LYJ1]WKU05687.1 CHAT domain-containing protein [Micromonospora sp. HUAS LYJ1]
MTSAGTPRCPVPAAATARTLTLSWSAGRPRATWSAADDAGDLRYWDPSPDGTLRCHLDGQPLTGRWWQHGDGPVAVTAYGDGQSLEGFLACGPVSTSTLTAVLLRPSLDGPVTTHLVLRLRIGSVGAPKPDPDEPEPWPEVAGGFDEAVGPAQPDDLPSDLRVDAVDRHRRWLDRPTLPGRWLVIEDPGTAGVDAGQAGDAVIDIGDPTTLASVRDPAAAGGPAGSAASGRSAWFDPPGLSAPSLVRLVGNTGLAVALVPEREAGPGRERGGWRPVVLRRAAPASGDPAALRALALDRYAAGRPQQAVPLANAAVSHYLARLDGHTPSAESAAVDLALLVNSQIVGAFALRDYPALLDGLSLAVRLTRRHAGSPPALTLLRRLGVDTADLLRDQATLLRAAAAGRTGPDATAGRAGADAAADCAARLRRLVATVVQAPPDDPDAVASATAACRAALDRTARELRRLAAAEAADARPAQPLTTLLTGTAELAASRSDALQRADVGRATAASRRASRASASPLPGYVERWRALLDRDWDKIFAAERAVGFFARLVELLTDLGDGWAGLVASEQSRARAFADLLRRTATTAGATGVPGRPVAPALDAPALAAVLRAHGRSVVEYFLHDCRLTVWTIRADGTPVTAVRVVDPDALAGEIDRVHTLAEHQAIQTGQRHELTALLARLGTLLWTPVAADLLPGDPDEPVTVVPHGVLLRVPFPALIMPDGGPLATRHAIELLPGLAVLPELRARARVRQDRPARLAALVNPQPMPPHPTQGIAFPALYGTERDFGAIARQYPGGARVVRGAGASLAALVDLAGDADVLYLATHADAALVELPADPAAVDREASSLPFFVVARTADHDGIVDMEAVLRLRPDADLVVLACCRGGRGAVAADGVIGMVRAFLVSGPTALLTALCEVGEETSMRFLYEFHREWLGTGRSVPAAVRRAQVCLMAEEPTAPDLWLGFVLFGAHR